jgi:uncharacterized protein (DUF1499 family)
MVRSGFMILLGFALAIFCWLGVPNSVEAAPIPSTTDSLLGEITLFSFTGQRPTTLGVKDGKLAVCPNTPNCVSSQTQSSDQEHFIAPFPLATQPGDAIAKLKSILAELPRTKIISETDSYLYAEFSSALMGFVDDVEFYADKDAGLIHVRSASRLGQSDLGVNRKRVEDLRSKFVTPA